MKYPFMEHFKLWDGLYFVTYSTKILYGHDLWKFSNFEHNINDVKKKSFQVTQSSSQFWKGFSESF